MSELGDILDDFDDGRPIIRTADKFGGFYRYGQCCGKTATGKPCKRHGAIFVGDAAYCHSHAPGNAA